MKKVLFLFAVLLLTVSSFADDYRHINTEPYWDNYITGGFQGQAQVFEAPANTDMLVNWEFKLAGRSDPGQVTFNVFEWGPTGPVGNALYSQTLDWGTEDQVFDVTNIDLHLDSGQLYGADIDLQGYSGNSVYFNYNQRGYRGYNGWWYDPNSDGWLGVNGTNQYFTADFQYVPEPSTLLLLGSSLLGIAVSRRR